MKSEVILDAIGMINDDTIRNAKEQKRSVSRHWVTYGAVAACFCAMLVAAYIVHPFIGNSHIDVLPDNPGHLNSDNSPGNITTPDNPAATPDTPIVSLFVNQIDTGDMMMADMDVEYAMFNELTEDKQAVMLAQFSDAIGMSYDNFTTNVPDGFVLKAFYSILSKGMNSTEYQTHDYVFEYQTDNSGSVTIKVCALEQPLRDCFFTEKDAMLSQVNDTTLSLYSYEDAYYMYFSYNGVYYDIETSNMTIGEVEAVLLGIIK